MLPLHPLLPEDVEAQEIYNAHSEGHLRFAPLAHARCPSSFVPLVFPGQKIRQERAQEGLRLHIFLPLPWWGYALSNAWQICVYSGKVPVAFFE